MRAVGCRLLAVGCWLLALGFHTRAVPGPLVPQRRPTAGRAFTIVELMVSIVIAAAALVGVYYYYATVQYSMREQAKLSQAQFNARLGMELLASDLQRAGYLATPNSDTDPLVCRNVGSTPIRVHALVHTNADPLSVTGNAADNVNIAPDSLRLYGNYLNADEYLADTILAGTGTIYLQPLIQYPIPEFADGGGGTIITAMDDAAFCRLFPTTALLRIVDRHGFMQFQRISRCGTFLNREIGVVPPVQQTGPTQSCGIDALGEGSRINVVTGILYRIELDPADPTKSDLVRWMVDENGNPIAGTREVVIEYAVDLQAWFRGSSQGPPEVIGQGAIPPDTQVMIGALPPPPPPPDGTLAARPERLRAAIVRLTVRTRFEDPRFPFRARADFVERIRSINVTPAEGAAHVRSYTMEVQLPNISLRNL